MECFLFTHQENLKLILCNLNDLTQKLLLLYLTISKGILLQSLKLTRLNKFAATNGELGIGFLNRSLANEIIIKKDKPFG